MAGVAATAVRLQDVHVVVERVRAAARVGGDARRSLDETAVRQLLHLAALHLGHTHDGRVLLGRRCAHMGRSQGSPVGRSPLANLLGRDRPRRQRKAHARCEQPQAGKRRQPARRAALQAPPLPRRTLFHAFGSLSSACPCAGKRPTRVPGAHVRRYRYVTRKGCFRRISAPVPRRGGRSGAPVPALNPPEATGTCRSTRSRGPGSVLPCLRNTAAASPRASVARARYVGEGICAA